MPRLEIELTSERPDGTWTWRAAGARQPKGVVTAGLVPGGAKVGDVMRAEADFEIDGINVTALAPRAAERSGPEILKLLGSQPPAEGVTTTLVGRRGRDRDDRPPRGPREEGARGGQRREGPPRDRSRPDGEGRGRPKGREGDTRGRPPRRDGEASGRPGRPERDRPSRPRTADTEGRPSTSTRPDHERRRPPRPETGGKDTAERRPSRQRPPKFQPGRTHRDAVLTGLPEEQRPVAEQVLKGGVRAVREALTAQNIDPGPMVTLAENLAPALRAAEWRDRADAALTDPASVPLRELRAIVTSANDLARGEEGREAAAKLKQALTTRMEAQRTEWVEGISAALDANRPLRALRQATRSPGPGARLPAELATRLAQAAGSAMTASTQPARWLDLLDAVVASPVSRTVRPEGLPAAADDELKSRARAAAGSVPTLAQLLGLGVPPPPVRRPKPAPHQPRRRPEPPSPKRPEAAKSATQKPAPASPSEEAPATVEQPVSTEQAVAADEGPSTEAPEQPEESVPSEQLDALSVGGDEVDDAVLVQELDQPGDDV
ncbi:MAG: hypothetical protein KY395_00465 [Actinobacteria bacterium]|nr:hypothetical protein [Actinomycetota bacterium]